MTLIGKEDSSKKHSSILLDHRYLKDLRNLLPIGGHLLGAHQTLTLKVHQGETIFMKEIKNLLKRKINGGKISRALENSKLETW